MIRYGSALEGIQEAVGQSWLDRARERTYILQSLKYYAEEFTNAAGKVERIPPFWNEIKLTYIKRQHGKCAYCETEIEWGEDSSIQWDLDHFRPKGDVSKWPRAKSPLSSKYKDIPTGDPSSGYYQLAYSLSNYVAACKTCNSRYKRTYFPIASARILAGPDPAAYSGENPYLVYPLGKGDVDPSDLLFFEGVVAMARYDSAQNPTKWRRATVIIDFFSLNREGLRRRRAHWLYHSIWPYVKAADHGDAEAIANLELARTEYSPHANCSACFIDLCATDRSAAKEQTKIFKQILKIP